MIVNKLKLKRMLENFFLEDLGEGDRTTDLIIPKQNQGRLVLMAKETGIFSGVDIIRVGFPLLNESIEIELNVSDGSQVKRGEVLAIIKGSVADLLKGERVILNLIQRMSGVATLTNQAVQKLNCSETKICDTRKTTPGLRMLEKYAVRCGGGFNHRSGLYDGVMIKDNHIECAGSIKQAVEQVKKQVGHMIKIEVETETMEQVIEAVEAKVDIIMFDNCQPDQIRKYIKQVPKEIATEASGGIQLSNLASYRETGVDYISLGFLTHSYQALDMSANLLIDK